MFDLLAAGPRHPFHNPTSAPFVISMTAHIVAVTLLVVLPLLIATDKLPVVPTMMAFVVAAPPPPPPPPPAAPKPAAQPPAAAKPLASAAANAAPLESPAEITPEPVGRRFDGEGSSEGVEGGLEGGVAGGIVGGLLAVAPPPPPPAPPAPTAVVPVRVGGAIRAPSLVKRVEPIYPQIAMTAQVTGTVILEAAVSATGEVESVRVLRSIKLLDQAAIDAVQQWRYAPLELNGTPTPFVLTVTLTFSIARRPS